MTAVATSKNVSVSCPAGKIATGGGAATSQTTLMSSMPTPSTTGATPTGWTAAFTVAHGSNSVYVICAN